MAHLYKRGNLWWFKLQRKGQRIRESTRETDYLQANIVMERRVTEIDGILGTPGQYSNRNFNWLQNKFHVRKIPRVALFDIETSPMEFYGWQLKQNGYIPHAMIKKDWAMLCWSARWIFEGDCMSGVVSAEDAAAREDASIMGDLWKLLDEADVIIGHNGAHFDVPRSNFRLAVNGYKPPSPFQVIDTLTASRKAFGSTAYTQDFLNSKFGLSPKISTNMDLWKRCVSGGKVAEEALDEMLRYNAGDVMGLEELYITVAPWIKTPVNLAMYTDNPKRECGTCLSTELTPLSKPYTTKAGQYESYRCDSCGSIGRSRYTGKSLEQRINSIIPTAR